MQPRSLNVTYSKNYFRPDYSRASLRYDRPKNVPRFCMGSVCNSLTPVSATGATRDADQIVDNLVVCLLGHNYICNS